MTRSVFFDPPVPLAFAHRGGATTTENLGIENSLAAFSNAYRRGYRYFETDARATRDRVAYACHDARLGRLTGHDGAIAELSSAELDALLLSDTEPIVRLEVLLDAFVDVCFNIDVKSADAIEPVCRAIERVHAVDRVCLASFSHRRLSQLRSRLPDAAFSASSTEVARAVSGLGMPRRAHCLQVPVRTGSLPIVTPRLLRRAHRAGLQVHVWTVDDPAAMHALLDLGVDGLMTDRLDLLENVLLERGQWKEPL